MKQRVKHFQLYPKQLHNTYGFSYQLISTTATAIQPLVPEVVHHRATEIDRAVDLSHL